MGLPTILEDEMAKPGQVLPDGYYRAALEFDTPGPSDPCVITWGGVYTPPTGPSDLAETIGNIVASNLDDIQSDNVTALSCKVAIAYDGNLYTGEFPINEVGNVGEAAAAPQVAVIFKKVSAFGGRSFRGRWYVPGVRYDAIGEDGRFTGTALTTAQDRANDIIAQLEAADAPMVILHSPKKIPGSDPPEYYPDPPAPTTVQSLVVESLTGTQRRRIR